MNNKRKKGYSFSRRRKHLLVCMILLSANLLLSSALVPLPSFAGGVGAPMEEQIILNIASSETRPLSIDRLLFMAFKDIDVQTDFSYLPTQSGYELANVGERDGVISIMPDMEEQYLNVRKVPVPLEVNNMYAVVQEKSQIKTSSWDDLKGHRVGILTQKPYISGHVQQSGASSAISKENNTMLLEGLVNGEYEIAIYSKREHEDVILPEGVKYAGMVDSMPEYLYLNKKHEDLLPGITKSLQNIFADGRGEKILKDQSISDKFAKKTIVHIIEANMEVKREEVFTDKLKSEFEDDERIEWYSMSLDTKRFSVAQDRLSYYANILRRDSVSRDIAAIIVSGDEALDFLKRYYYQLFRNVPVLFYGVSEDYNTECENYSPYFFGIKEQLSAYDTADVALRLFPDTKNIYVINGCSVEGEAYRRSIEKQLEPLSGRVNITYSGNVSRYMLLMDLKGLPPGSIVLLGAYFRDANGQYYSEKDMRSFFDSACSAPIFALYSTDLGYNAIGGKCLDYEKYAEIIAGMLKRVLSGEIISEVISDSAKYNRWVFDQNLMNTFGIKKSSLPKDSQILNKKVSVWESNPAFAYSMLVFSLICLALIAGLSVFAYKYRSKALDLLETRENLHTAEEVNKLKSNFLSNMSHEIRTPMNAVIGLTEIELNKGTVKEAQDVYKKINTSAKNLLQIINDILDLSKIEANKLELYPNEFELEEVLNDALLVASPRLEGKQVELMLDASFDLPRFLIGDRTRLWQILKNFLDNAAKYTDQGHIILRVTEDKAQSTDETAFIDFEVSDTGIGMQEEQLRKAMLPYEQVYSESQKRYVGTGLGMPISKWICELMGGDMEIKSTLGKGTTIHVKIPFLRSHNNETQRHALEPVNLSELSVLAVDDDEISLEIMSRLLGDGGADHMEAHSGEEALEIIRKHEHPPFDIILLDYIMAGMNGLETARQIQEHVSQSSKLLMVTAYESLLVRDELNACGIDGVIEKPFVPSRFLKQICSAAGKVRDIDDKHEKVYKKFNDIRVLVVEDNEINREVAAGMLEQFGISTVFAEHGKQGIEVLNSDGHFDMVLMDLHMPVMDGYEATRMIRLNDKFDNMPIISLTADAMTEVIDKCIAAGMDDYLSKPIEMDDLYGIFLKWLPESKYKA